MCWTVDLIILLNFSTGANIDRFQSRDYFSIGRHIGAHQGEDKTWTRGPWTPTLDRVHGPLSWTGSMDPLSWTGSMDSFF